MRSYSLDSFTENHTKAVPTILTALKELIISCTKSKLKNILDCKRFDSLIEASMTYEHMEVFMAYSMSKSYFTVC